MICLLLGQRLRNSAFLTAIVPGLVIFTSNRSKSKWKYSSSLQKSWRCSCLFFSFFFFILREQCKFGVQLQIFIYFIYKWKVENKVFWRRVGCNNPLVIIITEEVKEFLKQYSFCFFTRFTHVLYRFANINVIITLILFNYSNGLLA